MASLSALFLGNWKGVLAQVQLQVWSDDNLRAGRTEEGAEAISEGISRYRVSLAGKGQHQHNLGAEGETGLSLAEPWE